MSFLNTCYHGDSIITVASISSIYINIVPYKVVTASSIKYRAGLMAVEVFAS